MSEDDHRSAGSCSTPASGTRYDFHAENIFPAPEVELRAIDGVRPAPATIADGSYPLVTDVFVVVREDTATDATAVTLRHWQLRDDGREAIAASGYVPLP